MSQASNWHQTPQAQACEATGGALDDECGCPPCLHAHQLGRQVRMAEGWARLNLRAEAAERASRIANRLAPKPVHAGYDFRDGAPSMFARMLANGEYADRWRAIRTAAYPRILAKLETRARVGGIAL